MILKRNTYFYLHSIIAWSNFTLTAATIYLYLGVPLMMREQGWSGTEIGAFQASSLPIVIKFLFASQIDKFRFKQSNYLKWSLLLGTGFILCLFALSLATISITSFKILFIIAMVFSLITSWLDVPINALAIQYLPENERIKSGVIRSSVTAFASVIGGGLMLFVYTKFGWAMPFYIFIIMAILAGLLLYKAQPFQKSTQLTIEKQGSQVEANEKKPNQATESFWSMWKGYFNRPNMLIWNLILILYFPFIGAAWLYLKPVMLDLGIPLNSIATIASVCSAIAALASFTYSFFITRISARYALFAFSIVNIIALFSMYVSTSTTSSNWQLITAAIMVAIALGLSSGVLFGLMMKQSRPHLSATDYGLQSSLFSFTRILVPISAGIFLDKTGYSGMFLWLIAGASLTTVLTFYWIRMCAKESSAE